MNTTQLPTLTLAKVRRLASKQAPGASVTWTRKPRIITHATGAKSRRAEVLLTAPGFRPRVMTVDVCKMGTRLF